VERGLLCRLLNPTGNIEWAAIYHEEHEKARKGRETGKRRWQRIAPLGYNARPRKKEAARKSGLSLGRKRPRRAYGDKSPRALNMVRCTKRQEQKLRVVAKARARRLICDGVIFLHQWGHAHDRPCRSDDDKRGPFFDAPHQTRL
jgi:hypothetical protein